MKTILKMLLLFFSVFILNSCRIIEFRLIHRFNNFNKEHQKTGIWFDYYENNGRKYSVTTFINGKENGKYVSYYNNGKFMEKGYYNDSNKLGIWEEYFETGQLKNKKDFKNDSTFTLIFSNEK